MPVVLVQQALLTVEPGREALCVAQSTGADVGALVPICTMFAAAASKPFAECLFAWPLGRRHIAIVRVRAARTPWQCHAYTLARSDYLGLGGDPFLLADRWQAFENASGELPELSLPAEPLAYRTLEEVQAVLKSDDGPTLLGAAQSLVDGSRVVFPRREPDADILRRLWMLLPTSTRATIWPCTLAASDLGFHAVVTRNVQEEEWYQGHVTEEQAGDYPAGFYERSLQVAAEAGDQQAIDALFARRSLAETWRLGLVILGIALILLVVMNWFNPPPRPREAGAPAVPARR
jgi:hypothetical protein